MLPDHHYGGMGRIFGSGIIIARIGHI